jgi:putative hydrolase of the HAD superfamily
LAEFPNAVWFEKLHPNKDSKPKLIFFDAAGTLIEVRGSVGEVYASWAQQYGVSLAPATLQPRFVQAFRAQPPLAFSRYESEAELKRLEFAWWQRLVRQVFAEVEFPRFAEFFATVFEYFRRPEAWQLYEDVLPTLAGLQARGIQLAVLSNFDTRLEDLLKGLGLSPYLVGVHLSSRIGAAKPDVRIFQAALQAHGVQPHEAWHVGDSWREDLAGAEAAGLRAFIIDRTESAADSTRQRLICLTQLVELID